MEMAFALGFIAGEGHFGVTKNYQWKPYVSPRFQIQVHERDAELLHALHVEFGGIGEVKSRSNRPHVEWNVKKKSDIEGLRNAIERNAGRLWESSDKAENFEIWSDIVDIYCVDRATTTEERLEIAEMAKELNKDAGHNNVDWDEFQRRLREHE